MSTKHQEAAKPPVSPILPALDKYLAAVRGIMGEHADLIGRLGDAVRTLQDEQAELRDELHALSRTLDARTEHAV